MKCKRIFIDATTISNKFTGAGNAASDLLIHLSDISSNNVYYVFLNSSLSVEHPVYKIFSKSNFHLLHINSPDVGFFKQLAFLFFFIREFFPLKLYSYDVFHSLNWDPPFIFFRNLFVTIHDLKYILYPKYLSRFRFLKWLYMYCSIFISCRLSKVIFTPSYSTKNDLFKSFSSKINANVVVNYWGFLPFSNLSLDSISFPSLPEHYVLYVGERRPHKNLINAILAFHRSQLYSDFEFKFLLVGKDSGFDLELIQLIDKYNLHSSVILFDQVTPNLLDHLYRNASIFIFISLYEGFGIPLLEAMYYKVPIITSNSSSLPEIADDAAILLDPLDVDSIAVHLRKVVLSPDLSDHLVQKGSNRLSVFNWKASALRVFTFYMD